jgi:pyruvate dehydrogenase E1 component
MVPEAVEAARFLHDEGIAANVFAITSADRLYAGLGDPAGHLATLIPERERRAPIVTVIDGASSTLAFLGAAFGVPVVPLGVDRFGQSGTREDVYRHFGIDAEGIVAASFRALDGVS